MAIKEGRRLITFRRRQQVSNTDNLDINNHPTTLNCFDGLELNAKIKGFVCKRN
jgi:hypothetical protein